MGFTGSSGPRRTESTHANTCSSPALLLLRDCLAIPAPRSSLPIARRDPRGQAASPSRRFALLRPSSAGPPGLRSSPEFSFQPAPVGGYRPPLLGFVPGTLAHRRHRCRSRAHRLDFSAPPSTSSPASTDVPSCHAWIPGPTSSFRTTLPVFSAARPACAGLIAALRLASGSCEGLAGLLHPAADPGVRYVSTRRWRAPTFRPVSRHPLAAIFRWSTVSR
jgi:hypothetical protein